MTNHTLWENTIVNGQQFSSLAGNFYRLSLERKSKQVRLSYFCLPKFITSCIFHSTSSGVTGSIRDDPYWISKKNSLELIELYILYR